METIKTKERNIVVPFYTQTLAYLHLAFENMSNLKSFIDVKVKDKETNKMVNNPLNKFYREIENHIKSLECYVTTNFAGKWCLKCGIEVPQVLYCEECDKVIHREK